MIDEKKIIDSDAHVFEPPRTSGCVTWMRRCARWCYSGPRGWRMATARATMGRKVVFHLGSFLKPVARIFFNWPADSRDSPQSDG